MKLYKYYPLTQYSKRVLTHQEIYFSPFKSLNDPFELSVDFTFECDYAVKHAYFMKAMAAFNMYPPERQKETIASFEQLYASQPNSLIQTLRESFSDNGVFCLSENPKDILMWGHYSNKHRGFCIEIETDKDPIFQGIVKVNYHDSVQPTLYYDTKVQDIITKKFKAWAYEAEWRVLKRPFGIHQINPQCIERVFVGALNRFRPTTANEFGDAGDWFDVTEVAHAALPHVRFQNLMISKTKYELVTY